MFIVWGKKRVRRRLGYVADFCPLCRDLRVFKVKRVGIAGHVYYISFGEGQLVGHIRTCAACDTDLNATPENYREIHPKKLPAEELAALTFPNWREAHAGRLAIEKDLARGSARLSAQDRQALIREPFRLLGAKVEERFSASHLDWPTLGAIAGFFVLLAIAGAVGNAVPAVSDAAFAAALIIGIAGIAYALLQIRPRFFRHEIFPALVPALRPLKPSPDELRAVLKEMKSRGEKIGRKLPLNALVAELAPAGQMA